MLPSDVVELVLQGAPRLVQARLDRRDRRAELHGRLLVRETGEVEQADGFSLTGRQAAIACRTRAIVSAATAASSGPGEGAAGSPSAKAASSDSAGRRRSHRATWRHVFSAIPSSQAPKRSSLRRRSSPSIAVTTASCAASRAHCGSPSARRQVASSTP